MDAVADLYETVERNRRVAAIEDLVSGDYVHLTPPPGMPRDRRTLRTLYEVLLRAFPDLETRVESCTSDGGRVVAEVVRTGTHTGNFFNAPASGRRISFSSTEIFTLADDGRIASREDRTDWPAVLAALGFFDVPDGDDPGVVMESILIPVADVETAERFYRATLEPLGYRASPEAPPPGSAVCPGPRVAFTGPGESRPSFRIGQGVLGANRVHFAFRFDSAAEVDRFHQLALAAGGTDNGPPGPRSFMPPNYYGAFVIDPDGHEAEAVHWSDGP